MSDDDLNVTISEDGPDSSATEDLLNVVVEDSFSSDDLDAQVSEDDLDISTQEDSLTVDVGDMGLLYHNKTSGKQGGDVDLDEYYHLSSDNNDNLLVLVGGGDTDLHYHSADRARANHTGTQLLATISDAGSMAAQDADDYLLKTGGVLSGALQINVPTAALNGLILKTTDDDPTKPLLKTLDSGDNITSHITPIGGYDTKYGLNLDFVTEPDAADVSLALVAEVGNVDAGEHYYFVSFVTDTGETGVDTSPFNSITTDASNGKVTVTIPTSTDFRVTQRKIYRTKADDYFWLTYLVATINDNTTTEYEDNIADSGLGVFGGYYRSNTTNKAIMKNGVTVMVADDNFTALGLNTSPTNMTGGSNTHIGDRAGRATTTGVNNTYVGSGAGEYNITGTNNVGIGLSALQVAGGGTGNYNIGIGRNAGLGVLSENNVFVGAFAGNAITTGWGNTFIGARAGYSGSTTATVRRSIGIGWAAQVDASNMMALGGAGADSVQVAINATSAVGQFDININSASRVGQIIKGAVGQSANGWELQSSSGVAQLAIAGNMRDFVLDTTTGTKFGTATNQKLAFWNKTPIVQPTNAIAAAAFVANSSGIVDDTATYGGYTIGQLAAIIINSGLAA